MIKRLEAFWNQVKSTLCIWFGCSPIVHSCFGEITCARCGDILGDTLMGCVPEEFFMDKVIIGHNCKKCRETYLKLSRFDRFGISREDKRELRGMMETT
jgi:hypothetical protein